MATKYLLITHSVVGETVKVALVYLPWILCSFLRLADSTDKALLANHVFGSSMNGSIKSFHAYC